MGSILYSPAVEIQPAVRSVVFSPLLAVPAFAAINYAPEQVQNALAVAASKLPAIAKYLPQDLTKVKTYATIWFAISIVRQINYFLNMMACNSWRMGKAPGWNWPEEIAVVTGGSSGIGKDVVERLAKLGVRVAIFDVQPAPKEMLVDPKVRYYKCDVTSSESIAKAAEGGAQRLWPPHDPPQQCWTYQAYAYSQDDRVFPQDHLWGQLHGSVAYNPAVPSPHDSNRQGPHYDGCIDGFLRRTPLWCRLRRHKSRCARFPRELGL